MGPGALAVAGIGAPRGAPRLVAPLPAVPRRTHDLGPLGNVRQEHRRLLPSVRPELERPMEDVHAPDLPLAVRQGQPAPDLGEFAGRFLVEVQLVAEAALEPAARAGDLGRAGGKPLVLGHLERDRLELPEPRGTAELAAAGAHASDPSRLVANADLPKLDPRAENGSQILDQLPEIDPLLGGEEERDAISIPLEFAVHQLHVQGAVSHPVPALDVDALIALAVLNMTYHGLR